ncbi:hypothetical protein IT570_04410 [Candidatus Sumerlaeota bacterium]|nr:hypothetical protein [Candidatus Sumerlaeota bacterium]
MLPFAIDREDRRPLLLFAAIAMVEALVLFAISWRIAGGHFMLPLDDAYIHLQYARQVALGEPLVYTHGMQPSGGMTSPFYVLLLAPALLAGLNGVKGALAAFALGTASWMLLVAWTFQLAKRLANQACAMIAAALLLANGHLLWCALSGMETALFSVLVMGALLAAQTFWRTEQVHARVMLAACLGLLPLTRPEGALVSAAVLLVLLLRRGEQPRTPVLIPILALVPFILWLGLLKYATGDWKPSGLTIKGIASHPYMQETDAVRVVSETLSAIATRFYSNEIPDDAYAAFKGTGMMPYVPAGLGVLAALGAAFVVVTEFRARRFGGGTLLAIVWVAGLCSVAASWLPFVHQQRYLAPWTPLAILLAMIALRRIAQLFQQLEQTAVVAGGITLVGVSLPSLGFWMTEYGRNSRDIYSLLRVATFSLQEEARPVAITDAGVLAYYTNAPLHDLVGLCSPEFTHATLQGEGATLEVLGSLPTSNRPHAVIGYDGWFSKSFPFGATDWNVSIGHTSITSGVSLTMREIDWQAIDRGNDPPPIPGSHVLLEVDVANAPSERAAGYEARHDPYSVNYKAWPQPLAPIVESPAMHDEETSSSLHGLRLVDGARRVVSDQFNFGLKRDARGSLELVARIRSIHDGPEPYHAQGILVSATSRKTGFKATQPVHVFVDEADPYLRIPLDDLLDQAGGNDWMITIQPGPADAAFISAHYWIIEIPIQGEVR